jgi:hypothetical protein
MSSQRLKFASSRSQRSEAYWNSMTLSSSCSLRRSWASCFCRHRSGLGSPGSGLRPFLSRLRGRTNRPRNADTDVSNQMLEHPAVFEARFSRCRRLLHFIACRVLGGPERADNAVANCWLAASHNPPRFEHEGAFRSWLLRVLIDEALAIVRKNKRA